MAQRLKCNLHSYKNSLRENVGVYLHDLELGNSFLYMSHKVQSTKETTFT